MKRLAVIYMTSTGNTEMMADALIDGSKLGGGEGVKINASQFDVNTVNEYDALAFGCPAMGDEQLDEYEFEPMFMGLLPNLVGKSIVLFGSYGWGDGEWMRDWVDRMNGAGATVVGGEGVICQEAPDDEAISNCKALGKQLAAL